MVVGERERMMRSRMRRMWKAGGMEEEEEEAGWRRRRSLSV